MSGFVRLDRDAFSHPVLRDPARFHAWFWLIANACWKPTRYNINGKSVTLERGQLCASIRQLAEAWNMSKSAADRFITRLKTETMIVCEAGHGKLVITVCNYNKYQSTENDERDTGGTATGTASGHERDIKEQGNKETSIPNGIPSDSNARDPFPKPDWADSQVWRDLKANRKAKRLPCTPTAHAKLLRDIGKLSSDEWPPGRLLEAIVARGWAAAYDPRESTKNDIDVRSRSNQGHRESTRAIGERLAARIAAGG